MFRTITAVFAGLTCLLACFLLIGTSPAIAQVPTWAWGLQSTNPTPTDGTHAGGEAVATDAAGRVFVGGNYRSYASSAAQATRSFGSAGSAGPGWGAFVAQATAAGQWAWRTNVAPVGVNSARQAYVVVSAVAVSATGDVYAAGFAQGSSVRVDNITAALPGTGDAVFVAKLTATGVCQWVTTAECFYNLPALAVDPSTGGVVLAGTNRQAIRFGATTLAASPGMFGSALFVARLSPTGGWLAAAGSTGSAQVSGPISVAVSPTGSVAVACTQGEGELDFGFTRLRVLISFYTAYVVAQLTPGNQWGWAVGNDDGRHSRATDVAYTANGSLWACGYGTDYTQVGPVRLMTAAGATSPGMVGFVGQLSTTGQWGVVRALAATGNGGVQPTRLCADGAGNAVVLGSLSGQGGPVQAPLGTATLVLPATGELHFLATLNNAGQWRHIGNVPLPALPFGLVPASMALDANASLYLSGSLSGTLAVGNSTLAGTTGSGTNPNQYGDAVLLKMSNATLSTGHAQAPASTLALFPSPAHTSATLRLPAPTPTETTFALLDALGRPARTFAVPAGATEATFDLNGLPAGLYLVRGAGRSARLVVE